MKNNELKEKILKNVKENIAISNIVNEVENKRFESKYIMLKSLTACVALILVGVYFNNSNIKKSGTNMAIQQVKDELVIGQVDFDKENDLKENSKEIMTGSANIEKGQPNFRGPKGDKLEIPLLGMDESTSSINKEHEDYDSIYNAANKSVDLKNIIKNILEAILSIF